MLPIPILQYSISPLFPRGLTRRTENIQPDAENLLRRSVLAQTRQSFGRGGERFVFFADGKTRKRPTEVLVGLLVKRAGGNAGDADFTREPARELKIVPDSGGRDFAPVGDDEITSVRRKNSEAGFF